MLKIIPAIAVLSASLAVALAQDSTAADRVTSRVDEVWSVRGDLRLPRENLFRGSVNPLSEGILYSFRVGNDGVHPYSPVIADSTGALYGTTSAGGGVTGGEGVVYKIAPVAGGYNEYILYRFHGPDGSDPQGGLISDNSGALYGTTAMGGAANQGTVFKLKLIGNTYKEKVLYSFQTGSDGHGPVSSLIADSNGALYGTTLSGGAFNFGAVFKLTRTGRTYSESILYSFQGGTDGVGPYASLLADNTGALYGTTYQGGSAGQGSVFKLTLNGNSYSKSTIYSFQRGTDCSVPFGALIADVNGALYGTTSTGGSAGQGCVFQLTPGGNNYNESILYSFLGGTDGVAPYGSLIMDQSGALYGTTIGGGALNEGTVFKLTTGFNGYTESVLYRFTGGMDGTDPYAALISDRTGAFYGTTAGNSGLNSFGSVFKLTPNGPSYDESILHSFHSQADGNQPQGALIADNVGALYGTTSVGGAFGLGSVFKLSPKQNGYSESDLYSFQSMPDGANPGAGLIADSTGALYGTTPAGGAFNGGSVYKLTPSGTSYSESVLHSFNGIDGASPRDSLLEDSTGALYGTTSNGGSPNAGVVFKLTPNGGGYNYSILYTFLNSGDGAYPWGALIADSSGALYGTTSYGGGGSSSCDGGCGTVFKLTPNGGSYIESVLYSFAGLTDGAHPKDGLIADSSGSLYGTTLGNRVCVGTVFKLTPIGGGYTHTVLSIFKRGGAGANPLASLIADSSGALYGTAVSGGAAGFGTVFKLTPIGNGYSRSVLYSFRGGTDGANPYASLIADSAGALYGTTSVGGKFGQGTVFKLIP